MWVLALDTATASTAVAVVAFDDGAPGGGSFEGGSFEGGSFVGGPEVVVAARRRHVDPRAHGERLAPQVGEALAEAGIRPGDLAAIVAGTGPGPFTGLRVGLVTATAIGQALDRPAYGVCSLDGIPVPPQERDPVLVATDARRREVYWAVYRRGERLTDPAVSRPEEVPAAIAHYRVQRGYGEGALRYHTALGLSVPDSPLYPDPVRLAVIAYGRIAAGGPGEPLTPLYLRRPDAAEPRPAEPATAP